MKTWWWWWRTGRPRCCSAEVELPRRRVVAGGVRGEPLGEPNRVQLHLAEVEVLEELEERRK